MSDQDLIDTGNALNTYIVDNGCTKDPFQACTDFEKAWNASPRSSGQKLEVNGQYGPQTQAALQTVFNALFAEGSVAPDNCFSPTPKPPAPTPPPAPPPKPGPNVVPTTAGTDLTVPLLIGSGLIGAGILGVALYRKHKRKKRT